MSSPSEVFLFPLPEAVLFPETSKPLHIFEPRYLQMLEKSIETNTPIALAMANPYGEMQSDMTVLATIRRIAGYGRPHILERKDDGTILILLEGLGKVEVFEAETGGQLFLTGLVRVVPESEHISKSNLLLLSFLEKSLEVWLEKYVNAPMAKYLFTQHMRTASAQVNHFCSLTIEDASRQQALLEMNDINDRLVSLSMNELAMDQMQ